MKRLFSGLVLAIVISMWSATCVNAACVPDTSFKPFPTFMTVPESNADHGETLGEVIKGIQEESYEYQAMFAGGSKLFEVTSYNTSMVEFAAWWPEEMGESVVSLHNHPKIGSFSFGDLMTLCRARLSKTAVIVDPENIYVLSAPAGWPTQDEVRSFFSEHFGFKFITNPDSGIETIGLDPAKTDEMVRDGYFVVVSGEGNSREVSFTSKLIEEYAKGFDLVYTVENLR